MSEGRAQRRNYQAHGSPLARFYDVVVVGGGPAGLATAIALSRLGRSVVVFEKSRYDRPRAGETFGGDLRPILQTLGAWEDFASSSPVPFRGVRSSWGSSALMERASIFHPFGEGWHVDRIYFDQLLARTAAREGVAVAQGVGVRSLARADGLWRIRAGTGEEVVGRYLVDASGRGAPATTPHIPGRRWVRMDRQVALVGSMTPPTEPVEPMLVLEAVQEGWWYSAPQPEGKLLAVLITDADLLPARGRPALAEHLLTQLGRSVHTAARNAGATLCAIPWITRSESGLLMPDRGPGWRAVGDAAMACDPLAGDGVVRVMSAAIEAAPEIDREIAAPDSSAANRELLTERFRAFLQVRDRYYGQEGRWPDSPFWVRRRPMDWKAAPLFLDPLRIVYCDGESTRLDRIAPVEALIPPGALGKLLDRLRSPEPAHKALTFLRSAAPLSDDRKLLVGLQLLISLGCVSVDGSGNGR